MAMFGGSVNNRGNAYTNELWVFYPSLSAWLLILPSGPVPTPVFGAMAVSLPEIPGSLFVYGGGEAAGGNVNQLYSITLGCPAGTAGADFGLEPCMKCATGTFSSELSASVCNQVRACVCVFVWVCVCV